MFKRLRIRFILIASLAISILMAGVLGVTTAVRYYQTQRDISLVLQLLSDNKGNFPSLNEAEKQLGRPTSQDSLNQYRFLSVRIDEHQKVSDIDASNIYELSETDAQTYTEKLIKGNKKVGRFWDGDRYYAYHIRSIGNNQQLLIILDATNNMMDYQAVLNISLWLGIIGIGLFILLISALSQKVIEPYVKNYEKQKRFITNAGHELKTPLAIISANNELVELMSGESEWTKSTADQVHRLTGLINQMVTLARLEEQEDVELHKVNFSEITQDAAEDFKSLVIKDGKSFVMSIAPDIHVNAEEKSLFELVTILVDNANKYCDPGGQVHISLKTTGTVSKKAKLSISNTYKAGKTVDYSRFFERFYREDESHNNAHRSGYGIGLSMAESMVTLFKGKLSVAYKNDTITFTVLL
ncbi:sensor histidine kinase [Streptococcus hyovaginalis]|uniref:sensor histidine kinase n=1 Tax=Streptococcus hyovaginalis TaxID=149015 RepID=UPI003B3A4CA8